MDLGLSSEIAAPLSELLRVMANGEMIAHDCAAQQARAAEDVKDRRFFLAQAQHEYFHAFLFRRAATRLLPDTQATFEESSAGLRRYEQSLTTAIEQKHWDEVVIGQQLVLESLGELVLSKLDREMSRRGIGFQRIRSLILRQERSHHHFGTQWIERRLRDNRISLAAVRNHSELYIQLADQVLQDIAGLLEGIEADPHAYRKALPENMPPWATGSLA